MKKYYMTVPQQSRESLKSSLYKNPGGSRILECTSPTHFPLIPLILNTAEKGEKIQIKAVRPDHENTAYCLDVFKKELEGVNEKGIVTDLEVIGTSSEETIANHLALFGKLIETSADGDRVYADITFGTKPIPVVLMMFMNFMYKFRRDAYVENVIYGSFNHDLKTSNLYDVTALFYMNSTVNTMPAGTSDPEGFIRALLAM